MMYNKCSIGTLTNNPTKAFKNSFDNNLVSDHDTTLPFKIRDFTHGGWGSKFYKQLVFKEYDRKYQPSNGHIKYEAF